MEADEDKDVTPKLTPIANGPWTIPAFKAAEQLPVPKRAEVGRATVACVLEDAKGEYPEAVQEHVLSGIYAAERGPSSES